MESFSRYLRRTTTPLNNGGAIVHPYPFASSGYVLDAADLTEFAAWKQENRTIRRTFRFLLHAIIVIVLALVIGHMIDPFDPTRFLIGQLLLAIAIDRIGARYWDKRAFLSRFPYSPRATDLVEPQRQRLCDLTNPKLGPIKSLIWGVFWLALTIAIFLMWLEALLAGRFDVVDTIQLSVFFLFSGNVAYFGLSMAYRHLSFRRQFGRAPNDSDFETL